MFEGFKGLLHDSFMIAGALVKTPFSNPKKVRIRGFDVEEAPATAYAPGMDRRTHEETRLANDDPAFARTEHMEPR